MRPSAACNNNLSRIATSFLRFPRIFSELAKLRYASLPDATLSLRAGTRRAVTSPQACPVRRPGNPDHDLPGVSLARPEMFRKTDRRSFP